MNELLVTLALLQIVLTASSAAVLVYCYQHSKRMDESLKDAVGLCEVEKDKCVQIAKVLESSHNATSEAIKRLDLKVEDLNHKMLATQIGRAMPGR